MDVDAPKQRDLLYLLIIVAFNQIAASEAQPEEEKKLKLFPDFLKEGRKKQFLYL